MKRLLLTILIISLAGFALAQNTTKLKSNLTIEKVAPMLYLNGTSAGIDFYNGDITLQQSSNTLTLSGGDLALGANNITMTGALGATGGRILKGWFTDLEVTNTIAGTAAYVTGFTRNSGTLSLSGGHGITLTTTGTTSLTLPTSGTLAINPMTAAGDLVIGGTSGVPTRLAAGTDGYTLTMTAGAPAWGPPAGGGGAMIYPLAGIPISTGTSWGTSITDNHVQWDTAYVARNRWDGGAIGLTAATGRTSLGGTTVDASDFAALPVSQEAGIALLSTTRQADGSLPSLGSYFQLTSGSDAIDAGVDVGLPYSGSAPDIGAFEYNGTSYSEATDILTFVLSEQTGPATVNSTAHTVAIEIAYTAAITNLAPTITLSYGATVTPLSGVARDFTNPVPYTVTAEDGITYQEWTVTVTQEEAPGVPTGGSIVKFNGKIVKR